jgi:hypothetical protein
MVLAVSPFSRARQCDLDYKTASSTGRTFETAMLLQIVISPDCHGCEEASKIAKEMRRRFPSLEVELVILGGSAGLPENVVATPTYLIDGVPVSLGTPRRETLANAVEGRL